MMLSLTIFAVAPRWACGASGSFGPAGALPPHDQEIEERRLSPLFAQKGSHDGQAPEPWDFRQSRRCRKA
jgi:hypothetical protein